ncbi:hypothetical protein [Kineococcus glutinatus]|uniref:Thiosulfate dehydrogenase [quinone] large subunit n=1 Tax=Kineococcus glutinatus TaxID=1070872 RepID=A0ABP9I6F9_9ACTN
MSTSTTAPAAQRASATAPPTRALVVWPLLRIALGLVFLWTFLDKAFGLGYSTGRAEDGSVDVLGPQAWFAGGSPTSGFLAGAPSGPLAGVFNAMSGSPLVDAAFMLGMLCVGVALVAGVALRLATVGGVALMLLIRATMPVPESNPVVDEHLVYALLLVGLLTLPAARRFSLHRTWSRLPVVRSTPALH